VNYHLSLLIRCLLLFPLVIVTAFDRPVPTPQLLLQPIAIPPYKDAHLPVNLRVEDLLSRMNVEEKIRQLDMYWGKEVADMNGHEAAAWSLYMTCTR
jgi:hypothetical protein